MKPEDYWRTTTARIEAVRVVGSAVNPLLWLAGLVTPLSLLLGYLTADSWKSAIFFGFSAVPIVLFAYSYFALLRSDPDRLQSEEFRLKQRALKMIYRKGSNSEVLEAAKDIVKIQDATTPTREGDMG